MFKIIDNKKVEITPDEWDMYCQIIQAYTKPPYQKGEDFFVDLFETDEDGLIIFLKPPQRQISIEIFLFLVSLFQHQHMRAIERKNKEMLDKMQEKINELEKIKTDILSLKQNS